MRKATLMFLLCFAGALLNLGIGRIVLITRLPLFGDTIATISWTLLFGPWWGALTGALSNLFAGYQTWPEYLFALCNIATAFITWLFVRLFPRELDLKQNAGPSHSFKSRSFDKNMNRLFILTMLAFALCIAMSIMGGLITVFIQHIQLYEGAVNPSSTITIFGNTFFRLDLPLLLTEIINRIPINIVDRLIAAFAGFGLAFAGSRLREKLTVNREKRILC
jgi:ABC-type multidrug transport system permease subunit